MKDIPVFSCPDGIATLILREVPFRGRGLYTGTRRVRHPGGSACRMHGLLPRRRCGAAVRRRRSGFFPLSGRHPHSRAQRAAGVAAAAPEAVRLVPVTEETAADWAREYNARFRAVPAAESCSPAEERALAAGGEALWIWDGAERIGLGRVRGSELLAVAALLPARANAACGRWRPVHRARRCA